MKKTIFSIIFTIIIILSSIFVPFTVGAYEVTEFEVTADAGALISLDTGEFLYEKNLDKKIYPAAITNIMTAVIVLESEKYADSNTITMTEEALNEILGTGCAVSHLKAGEIITHLDLVHLITVTSCGDCSLLAAKYFGGSVKGFVKMMNEKAKELGGEDAVLVVVIARDSTVKKKKRIPVIDENQRLEMIKYLKPVDEAYMGYDGDMFKIVEEIQPDIIAIGSDQNHDIAKLQEQLDKRGIKAVAKRVKEYRVGELDSTCKIINRIKHSELEEKNLDCTNVINDD